MPRRRIVLDGEPVTPDMLKGAKPLYMGVRAVVRHTLCAGCGAVTTVLVTTVDRVVSPAYCPSCKSYMERELS